MNMLVEITETKLFDLSRENQATGESTVLKYQKLWVHIPGEPHPSKNKRIVNSKAPALSEGYYVFDSARAYSDWNWSRVVLSTRDLRPATADEIKAFGFAPKITARA